MTIAAQPHQSSIIPIQGKHYTLEMVGFSDCDVPGTPSKTLYT